MDEAGEAECVKASCRGLWGKEPIEHLTDLVVALKDGQIHVCKVFLLLLLSPLLETINIASSSITSGLACWLLRALLRVRFGRRECEAGEVGAVGRFRR